MSEGRGHCALSCRHRLAGRIQILLAGAGGHPRVLLALPRRSTALSWGCWAGTGCSGAGSSFYFTP